jgi:hypothetical protein
VKKSPFLIGIKHLSGVGSDKKVRIRQDPGPQHCPQPVIRIPDVHPGFGSEIFCHNVAFRFNSGSGTSQAAITVVSESNKQKSPTRHTFVAELPLYPVLADPVHFDRIRIRPLKKNRIRLRIRIQPKALKSP